MKYHYIYLLSSIAFLLSQGPSIGQVVTSSELNHQARIKEVFVGEKRERLKAELISDRGYIQIVREGVDAVSQVAAPLAKINITTVGPCGFDFVTTPDGELLWVFVQQMNTATRQQHCLIYPLAQEGVGTYTHRMIQRTAGNKQYDVPVRFDLTGHLQLMAMASFERGEPLALGHGARISDVQLESTNASSVNVIGKLGPNYSFRGTLKIGMENELIEKDFVIVAP
jgi:hypothetical protein